MKNLLNSKHITINDISLNVVTRAQGELQLREGRMRPTFRTESEKELWPPAAPHGTLGLDPTNRSSSIRHDV